MKFWDPSNSTSTSSSSHFSVPFGAPSFFGLQGVSLPPMPDPQPPPPSASSTLHQRPHFPSLHDSSSSSSIEVPSQQQQQQEQGSMMVSDIDGFFVANPNTIDPFLSEVREGVTTNPKTEEFVWHPTDCSLYRLDSAQGRQALISEPNAVKLRFPPGTMINTKEKDGALATPAYSPAHPHSNEW